MNTITLSKGDLRAQLLAPGSTRYRRARFVHAAFISNVWYRGLRFTQYERNQNTTFMSTEGCGLCCGYEADQIVRSAAPGEKYLMPGVGVLTRAEKPYGITDMPAFEPLDTKMTCGPDRAVYTTVSPVVAGFGYREERAVQLGEDRVTLTTTLKNTGDRPMNLTEYAHNFVSLGDEEIGPGYRLDTPAIADPAALDGGPRMGAMRADAAGFYFADEVTHSFYTRTDDVRRAPTSWRMSHERLSAAMSEHDSFTPCRVAIWGDYYVLSCEVFVPIELEPGKRMSWTREWEFNIVE